MHCYNYIAQYNIRHGIDIIWSCFLFSYIYFSSSSLCFAYKHNNNPLNELVHTICFLPFIRTTIIYVYMLYMMSAYVIIYKILAFLYCSSLHNDLTLCCCQYWQSFVLAYNDISVVLHTYRFCCIIHNFMYIYIYMCVRVCVAAIGWMYFLSHFDFNIKF